MLISFSWCSFTCLSFAWPIYILFSLRFSTGLWRCLALPIEAKLQDRTLQMDILPMPPDTSKTQDGRWTVLPSDHSSLKGGFPIGIMNICRSPTFRQSFRAEETWSNIKHAFCMLCVCVEFCKHFLRKSRSSNNLALSGFANLKFEL